MAAPKALIVSISGCSSSGKTTLARLLRDILPGTFILHEDDFYRPENEYEEKIPRTTPLIVQLINDTQQTPFQERPLRLGLRGRDRYPSHGRIPGLHSTTCSFSRMKYFNCASLF